MNNSEIYLECLKIAFEHFPKYDPCTVKETINFADVLYEKIIAKNGDQGPMHPTGRDKRAA